MAADMFHTNSLFATHSLPRPHLFCQKKSSSSICILKLKFIFEFLKVLLDNSCVPFRRFEYIIFILVYLFPLFWEVDAKQNMEVEEINQTFHKDQLEETL